MRSFLRAVLRLGFKRFGRIAPELNSHRLSQIEVCPFAQFTEKPARYAPKKGWRLLAHFGDEGSTLESKQMHDIELDEDILERIDFLTCLFARGGFHK
jgi:hypothetical protein